MSLNDEYTQAVAALLRQPDPAAALQAAIDAPETGAALRGLLEQIVPDGFRMSALLVAQLRFNRLLNGSGAVAAEFEADPRAASERFRRYHQQVPPTAEDPVQEAKDYRSWCAICVRDSLDYTRD